ncbi:hypothetical protein HPB52_001204 [Rhipicephalus sanguineus]|uniref:HTH CENPB-type domain-containing protein n=1 Tax=Rhipicephalus sanguineus TaxID=34632 RepID=A0A9D4PTM7_RHISA|nr:hypothetical protein HPB52_001204 [Rhipicephalus sanguineus]
MSRNRKPLTLGEKLRIIEEAEKRNGATKASIARDLNIPESSLKTILAKKDSILLNAAKFGLNRKAAKDGKYAAMEKALVEWLRQARSSGIAVDGAILKEKAETVALRCGIDDFKASNGWLDRFKKRSGVVYSRCCGESAQLQPLDAGVIKCMKQKYRKFLVQRRLAGMERKQLDKKLSVLDAMHYIASAWDAVTPETIANSFRHCGFNRSGACSTSEAALPVDDEPEFGSLELPGSFADYVGADDDVAVCSEVSLDDIIETVRPDTAGTSDEEEMDDAAEASVSVPTYADVLCYVDHIRRCEVPAEMPVDLRTKLILCLVYLGGGQQLTSGLVDQLQRDEDPEVAGDLFLDVAEALMEVRRMQEALPLLHALVNTQNYGMAAVWLRYGECLQQLGCLREATSAYERTCELAPGHAQARLALCQLLLAQGLTDRAIACLESADAPQQGAMGDADQQQDAACVLLRRAQLLRQSGRQQDFIETAKLLHEAHCPPVQTPNEYTAMFSTSTYRGRTEALRELYQQRNFSPFSE